MKKTIIAVLAVTLLAGCATQQQAPAPAPKPAPDVKLCSLSNYENGEESGTILNAVRVVDHGATFSFDLMDGKGWIRSMPLTIPGRDSLASATDADGFFFSKGTGRFAGVYAFASRKDGWATVFTCTFNG